MPPFRPSVRCRRRRRRRHPANRLKDPLSVPFRILGWKGKGDCFLLGRFHDAETLSPEGILCMLEGKYLCASGTIVDRNLFLSFLFQVDSTSGKFGRIYG